MSSPLCSLNWFLAHDLCFIIIGTKTQQVQNVSPFFSSSDTGWTFFGQLHIFGEENGFSFKSGSSQGFILMTLWSLFFFFFFQQSRSRFLCSCFVLWLKRWTDQIEVNSCVNLLKGSELKTLKSFIVQSRLDQSLVELCERVSGAQPLIFLSTRWEKQSEHQACCPISLQLCGFSCQEPFYSK